MALTGASTSVVDMSGDTTGLVIAKGTTAERDAISSPQAGMIRNNTETDRVEVYNGTDWRNLVEAGNANPPLTIEYLLVAGGGGGGPGYQAGGGGAGGLTTNYGGTSLSLNTSTAYAITVGAGGAGGIGLTGSGANKGSNGGDSKFASLPDAIGGGGGASYWNGSNAFGLDGGSGGGAAYTNYNSSLAKSGGAATTGQETLGGGVASGTYSSPYTGAGGGGAGSAGINGTPDNGNGGAGLEVNIIGGTGNYYAGGGGGGSWAASGGVGGSSIGGNGSQGSTSGTPTSGTTNTGSGGGGAGGNGVAGADGGSGIIILKYPDIYSVQVGVGLTSAVDSTSVPGYKVESFTSGTGTITFS